MDKPINAQFIEQSVLIKHFIMFLFEWVVF